VAVPTDYGNAKLRACKIEVLREVEKSLVPALFNRDQHITSEQGYVEDGDDFDNFDDEDVVEEFEETSLAPESDLAPDDGIRFPPSLTNGSARPTNSRKYYLAGEAGEWLVVRRSTGKVKKTFESRDAARARIRNLNS